MVSKLFQIPLHNNNSGEPSGRVDIMQRKEKRSSMRASQCLTALLFIICNLSSTLASTGHANGKCVSPGGHFPRFSSEGLPPRKSLKGSTDLTSCRIFRKKTCCSAAQTHPILLSIRKLASEGEASQECLALWELLECSICDPRVGVRPGPPVICRTFCDSVFQACAGAFFAVDTKTEILMPCGSKDAICGRGLEWASSGSQFCQLAGFSVIEPMDKSTALENYFCFDGRTSIEMLDVLDRTSQTDSSKKVLDSNLLQELYQWARQMDTSERICWAVGGMVLTAGIIFMSKRRGHSYRQKQAAFQRTKNMLEARVKQQSVVTSASKSRKGGKKR